MRNNSLTTSMAAFCCSSEGMARHRGVFCPRVARFLSENQTRFVCSEVLGPFGNILAVWDARLNHLAGWRTGLLGATALRRSGEDASAVVILRHNKERSHGVPDTVPVAFESNQPPRSVTAVACNIMPAWTGSPSKK